MRDERQAQQEKMRKIEETRAAGEAGKAVGDAMSTASSLPPQTIAALQGAVQGGAM